MPRRMRSMAVSGIYHITHRCHNKEFLFRFAKYRDIYLAKLLEMTRHYPLAGLAHQRELYWSRARAVGDETWLTDMVGKKRQANIHRNSDNEPFYLNYGKIK